MSLSDLTAKRWRGKSWVRMSEQEFLELAERAMEQRIAEELGVRVERLRDYLVREGARQAVLVLLEIDALRAEAHARVQGWADDVRRGRLLRPLELDGRSIVPPEVVA